MAFTLVNGVLTSRLLAPDDRGSLALILTVSALSYLISSLGTNTAVRVFQAGEDWASFRTYFRISALLFIFNTALIGLSAIAFVAFGIVESSDVIVVMVLLGLTTFISSQLLDVLNAQGLVSRSAYVDNLGHFCTLVVLSGIFMVVDAGQLSLVLLAYFAGFGTRVILSLVAIREGGVVLGTVASDGGRALVRQGVRFWGINLAQTLTARTDQLMLAPLSSTYAVGIYAVAGPPASVMQVVSNSVGQMALREAASGLLSAKRLFRASGIAFLITASYSVVMWIAAPTVIPVVFGSDYKDAVPIVRILLLAELARSPYLVLIRALAGLNRPFAASASSIAGLPIMVISMLLLVPQHGVEGAAFSVVITSALLLAASLFSVVGAFRRSSSTDCGSG